MLSDYTTYLSAIGFKKFNFTWKRILFKTSWDLWNIPHPHLIGYLHPVKKKRREKKKKNKKRLQGRNGEKKRVMERRKEKRGKSSGRE